MVTLLDRHAAPISLIFICFCEAIAVSWFYGEYNKKVAGITGSIVTCL